MIRLELGVQHARRLVKDAAVDRLILVKASVLAIDGRELERDRPRQPPLQLRKEVKLLVRLCVGVVQPRLDGVDCVAGGLQRGRGGNRIAGCIERTRRAAQLGRGILQTVLPLDELCMELLQLGHERLHTTCARQPRRFEVHRPLRR